VPLKSDRASSPEHNRAVGGAKASKQIEGVPFRGATANHEPEAFEVAARATTVADVSACCRRFGAREQTIRLPTDDGPRISCARCRDSGMLIESQ
jgi:hypothetical protein